FVYGNARGNNSATDFKTYQKAGAEAHSRIDTVHKSGFPVVAIVSPADQSSVSDPVDISATASDSSGINRVEFYVDWTLMATVKSSPYTYSWSGTSGPHLVVAMAYSNAGVRNCNAVTLNPASPGSR
ncbi:MAG: Ig-like domain-containing protein, partial [Candidatus Sulfotelmatobacter sp.]